jgi:hypothetical protein
MNTRKQTLGNLIRYNLNDEGTPEKLDAIVEKLKQEY